MTSSHDAEFKGLTAPSPTRATILTGISGGNSSVSACFDGETADKTVDGREWACRHRAGGGGIYNEREDFDIPWRERGGKELKEKLRLGFRSKPIL